MGLKRENVTVCDIEGVVYVGRPGLDPTKARYAQDTAARTLPEAGRRRCLPRPLRPACAQGEWLHKLAPGPLVLALANPDPEILFEAVRAARPDAIVATGGRPSEPGEQRPLLPSSAARSMPGRRRSTRR